MGTDLFIDSNLVVKINLSPLSPEVGMIEFALGKGGTADLFASI